MIICTGILKKNMFLICQFVCPANPSHIRIVIATWPSGKLSFECQIAKNLPFKNILQKFSLKNCLWQYIGKNYNFGNFLNGKFWAIFLHSNGKFLKCQLATISHRVLEFRQRTQMTHSL